MDRSNLHISGGNLRSRNTIHFSIQLAAHSLYWALMTAINEAHTQKYNGVQRNRYRSSQESFLVHISRLCAIFLISNAALLFNWFLLLLHICLNSQPGWTRRNCMSATHSVIVRFVEQINQHAQWIECAPYACMIFKKKHTHKSQERKRKKLDYFWTVFILKSQRCWNSIVLPRDLFVSIYFSWMMVFC